MTSNTTSFNLESMAFDLDATGQYRVLRKFVPQATYLADCTGPVRQAMIIDTETTGLKVESCKVIEIGYAIVTYELGTGAILRVDDTYSGLEDPEEPLSEEIIKVTGLHDEDLVGQHFDDARILRDLGRVSVVVCFNSAFDRPFLEQRYPQFSSKPFLCAMVDGPWKAMGFSTLKQEYLVYQCAVLRENPSF
ncbi:MAG: hypothetical protein HKM02_02535 [Pseudomonadales bacterium]|nr:hypothetical protein [Pseudomonadales bacterium]